MGEAKRRGAYEIRRRDAIRRLKNLAITKMGGRDEQNDKWLRAALKAFLDRLPPDAWHARKLKLIQRLTQLTAISHERKLLSSTTSVLDKEDEIAWYLFLCEKALEDPFCLEVNQAARALPFFAGIGARWAFAAEVSGLERKLDQTLKAGRKDPDGYIFEILVALSYAACGWKVELLEETSTAKTPDMVARKDGKTLFIECKRQSRRGDYSEQEREHFIKLWDPCVDVLTQNRQWIWFKCAFHTDIQELDPNFLRDALISNLPLNEKTHHLHSSSIATIDARLIDKAAVRNHFANYQVKADAPMISKLLGSDWAPLNSSTTIAFLVRTSHVADCEVQRFGTYVTEMSWASGITRTFDSEISIEMKARDVKRLLASAVEQVPSAESSVIHIAAETAEGADVERRRTEKIMQSIPNFLTGKRVVGVRLHLLQANQTIDKLYEFDETVEKFQVDGADLTDIPTRVVIPPTVRMDPGRHWEIYG